MRFDITNAPLEVHHAQIDLNASVTSNDTLGVKGLMND